MASTSPLKTRLGITNPIIWAESGLFSLIAMESVVFIAWYIALASPKATWFATVIFVWFAYLINYSLIRFLRFHKIKNKIRNTMVSLLFAFLIFIGTKYIYYSDSSCSVVEMGRGIIETIMDNTPGIEGFWHCLFFPVLLWRSIVLSKEIPGPFGAMRCFKTTIFFLIPYAALYAGDQPERSIFLAFIYIFFGLMTLTLTKLGYLSELRGGRLPKISAERFLGIILSAIAITVVTIVLSWIISGNFASFLVKISGGLIILIESLLVVVFLPILTFLFKLVVNIQASVSGDVQIMSAEDIFESLNQLTEESVVTNSVPSFFQKYFGLIILIVILLGFMVLAYFAIQWQTKKTRTNSNTENSESSGRSGIGLLAKFLRTTEGSHHNITNLRGLITAAQIHQIYAKLMQLSARLGVPRPVAMTPLEFIPHLNQIFPQEENAIFLITDAFIQVRYGELPESSDEIEEIIRAWKRIEHQGHILIRSRVFQKAVIKKSRN